jgi:class 3 adenylate cyclase
VTSEETARDRASLGRVLSDARVLRRAVVTAALVGSVLALVRLARGGAFWTIEALVAYLVPFVVSVATSWAAIRRTNADVSLLEAQVRAINRFPDQNPNPVMRATPDGTLVYANRASEPIARALGVSVGDRVSPEVFERLVAVARDGGEALEVTDAMRTFAVLPVYVADLDVVNLYGTDVTASKVIDKFPNENPNPVMRMDEAGALIYANAASRPLVSALGMEVGAPIPPVLLGDLRAALDGGVDELEVRGDDRTYRIRPVRIPEFGFVNLYGTDITAEKWITKFPDQNPNPVLRASPAGELVYANDASAPVTKGLGLELGDVFPADLFDRIRAIADAGRAEMVEVEGEGRVIALLPVWIPDFGFINLYGIDVTAARQLEQAHRENERLLLNILPAPIAERLKGGEATIADGFDEATVMFADVVGFTALASRRTPHEVVDILNRVFSRFDALVEEHGLEKVKTIGDAYMAVGGLENDADHVGRVAQLGFDMMAAVEELSAGLDEEIHLRLGMHTGPAVAGVIGIKKFIYDIWGDTVNMASRLESTGVPNRIQVARSTLDRLDGRYAFEERGEVELKGKGRVTTFLL